MHLLLGAINSRQNSCFIIWLILGAYRALVKWLHKLGNLINSATTYTHSKELITFLTTCVTFQSQLQFDAIFKMLREKLFIQQSRTDSHAKAFYAVQITNENAIYVIDEVKLQTFVC